jgi:2-iminobutanoate/2-iminopropanoate deaminase
MNSQEQAIGFTKGAPFSNGYVSGDTLYIAGQQGPDFNGKVTGTDIRRQTTNAIAAVRQVADEAGLPDV